MTVVEEYFDYTKKFTETHGNKTVVLMQVGSFFEVYGILLKDGSYKGSLIKEFAALNDLAIASKNTIIEGNNVFMSGFKIEQVDKYLKRLLENGYTIPLIVQDKQGSNVTRSVSCIYSPGTFFNIDNNDLINNEDSSDFNKGLSNNTMCIWAHVTGTNAIIKQKTLFIGLSIIDIFTGKLVNYEYYHPYIDSPTAYDELEKYIAIYNPTEVIIITNNCEDYDNNYIDVLINYANINAEKFHKVYLNHKKSVKEYNANEKQAYNCEKQTVQESIIDKIYGIGSFMEKTEFRDYIYANQSLCILLDFIYNHNPSLVRNINYPIFENLNKKLILANHSLKQLNIISDNRYNGKLSCISNFLNNCITGAGKRLFNYTLLNPICDINILNKSYEVIEHLLETKYYKTIRTELSNVRDFEKIERKLIMKCINPRDFFYLFTNLSTIKNLFLEIKEKKENNLLFKYLNEEINFDINDACVKYSNFIEKHFDLTKIVNISIDKVSNYDLEELKFINKNYSKDLNKLFKNSIDSKQQLNAISHFFSSLISDYEKPKNTKNIKNMKKSTSKNSKNEGNDDDDDNGNYVKIHETCKSDPLLIITKRRSIILNDILKELIKNNDNIYKITYISKYTNKEETIDLELDSIIFKDHGSNKTSCIIHNNLIDSICHAITNSKDVLIESIVKHYNKIVTSFENENKVMGGLGHISKFIGLLDLCHCKAYNAINYNYCKPLIFDNDFNDNEEDVKSYVSFKKMRHCLIEHINNKELYVSNDLSIGSMNNGMLLYGTNAVGKTSFIKSIGIAIILAQSGMYVPCEEFVYYPYNYLFTRILGNDNIFKGLSTFAVEMSELRTILKNATKNSIILGDELCSGTESTSALSIFVSSLEYLNKIESTFLFATHFHEILEYEEIKNLDSVKTYHMSVLFDKKTNSLIYDRKLKEGPGEAMYGLEVCKSLDLPEDFIERAYTIRNKYTKSKGTMIKEKKSRYNTKKRSGDICEICLLNVGTEIHHLQYQKNANNEGIINGDFHKDHVANLINICSDCHDKIHNKNSQFQIKKTTKGYKFIEI